MMARLGPKLFTSVCNLCNAASMFCYSHVPPLNLLMSPGFGMWLGLVFSIPGARKRDAVEALVMKTGSDAGFGKGFISGALMNWRAVINVVGPLLFGSVYTYGSRRNFPGLAFLVAAMTCVAAQGLTQSVSAEAFSSGREGSKEGGAVEETEAKAAPKKPQGA